MQAIAASHLPAPAAAAHDESESERESGSGSGVSASAKSANELSRRRAVERLVARRRSDQAEAEVHVARAAVASSLHGGSCRYVMISLCLSVFLSFFIYLLIDFFSVRLRFNPNP